MVRMLRVSLVPLWTYFSCVKWIYHLLYILHIIDVDTYFSLFSKLTFSAFHQVTGFVEYFWVAYMHRNRLHSVPAHALSHVIFHLRMTIWGKVGKFLIFFSSLKCEFQWGRDENCIVLSIYYLQAIMLVAKYINWNVISWFLLYALLVEFISVLEWLSSYVSVIPRGV